MVPHLRARIQPCPGVAAWRPGAGRV